MRTALRGAAVLAATALVLLAPSPAYADPTIDPAEVTIGPDGGATQVISGAGATGFNARFSPSAPPGVTVTDRYGERCGGIRGVYENEVECHPGASPYRINWPAITDPALDGVRYQVRVLGGGARDFGYATVVFPPPPTTDPPGPEPSGPTVEPTTEPTVEPSAEPSASAQPSTEPDPSETSIGGGESGGVNITVIALASAAGVGLLGLVGTAISIGTLRRKRAPRKPRPPVEYVDSGDAD